MPASPHLILCCHPPQHDGMSSSCRWTAEHPCNTIGSVSRSHFSRPGRLSKREHGLSREGRGGRSCLSAVLLTHSHKKVALVSRVSLVCPWPCESRLKARKAMESLRSTLAQCEALLPLHQLLRHLETPARQVSMSTPSPHRLACQGILGFSRKVEFKEPERVNPAGG